MAKSEEPYGWVEWLRARRIGLAPLYLTLPVLIFGIVCNLAPSVWWILIGLAAMSAGSWAWITMKVSEGWRRWYWAINVVSIGAWVAWASTLSTVRGWFWAIGVLTSGAIVLAVPHWVDQTKRTQVRMEGMVREWPIRGARIGLGDTRIRSLVNTPIGWTAKLAWVDGAHSVRKIEKMESEVEGALGLPRDSLKIDFDGRSNSSVILNVTLKDPHARAIMWDLPVVETEEGPQVETLHGADPFTIGLRADGTEKKLQMFVRGWGARNALIAGMKGSGKSGLLNLIWTVMALCDDVVQWGVDLKGGVELGPWRGTFDWIVTKRADAVKMLEAVEQLVERRSEIMAKRGWKNWQGSPENPWVLVSIDEAASLLGNATQKELDRISDIFRKGRAAGVALILATQYPTLEALGSSQIRQQIDQRFCFRMADGDGEGYVITAGTVNADKISDERPGTCYHQDANRLDKLAMRIVFVGDGSNGTDNMVGRVSEMLRGKTPEMDRDSIARGIETLELYANRFSEMDRDGSEMDERDETETSETAETEIPPWTDDGSASMADIVTRAKRDAGLGETPPDEADEEPETPRLSDEDARKALLSALHEAGPGGLRYGDLEKPTTRRKTWVYDRLNELEEEGQVRRLPSGTWALADVLISAE